MRKKDPSMQIKKFNEDISQLLQKILLEKKSIVLMGDYNINLLNYETDPSVESFIDTIYSNSLLPAIKIPTRLTSQSKTLIDNIFISDITSDIIAGNLNISISDHLAQIVIFHDSNNPEPKTEAIFKRDFKNFDQTNFLMDMLNIDWNQQLQLERKDVDFAMHNFYTNIMKLLNVYAPFKKQKQKILLAKSKPWISKALLKSVDNKNKIYRKFLTTKNNEYIRNTITQAKKKMNYCVSNP